MDVEKNSTSSVDRQENELFSFGGSATQKITRSNNPPIRVMLFWQCLEILKEIVQDRKKWRMLVEEKIWNRERTNVK